jgi:hypothetical protein
MTPVCEVSSDRSNAREKESMRKWQRERGRKEKKEHRRETESLFSAHLAPALPSHPFIILSHHSFLSHYFLAKTSFAIF